MQSDEIKPEEIIFTLDDMIEEAKVHAAETYKKNVGNLSLCVSSPQSRYMLAKPDDPSPKHISFISFLVTPFYYILMQY